MKTIHGGKAHNAQIDSPKRAVLLRGGLLSQAYVYPADMRATRDLLRRRMPLMRTRAAVLAPIHNTKSQYHVPDIGTKLADKANRDGVAERFPEPAVPKSMEVDLALINHYACLLGDSELSILQTAKQHHAHTRYRRRPVPGSGEILSLVLLDEIQDIGRFPRLQAFVSSGRLVQGTKESAGKRDGTSGPKLGNAYLTGAFSEAAVLCLRNTPAGQKYLTNLEKPHGQGKAFTMLAQKLGRAVYDFLQRQPAFARRRFLSG
jgi:hypothetical protein